jgi:hypothetical protein
MSVIACRQSLRESEEGFIDGGVYDAGANFHEDPVEPRLWNLLSREEFERCVMMLGMMMRMRMVMMMITMMDDIDDDDAQK